jgi:hypothetical protein
MTNDQDATVSSVLRSWTISSVRYVIRLLLVMLDIIKFPQGGEDYIASSCGHLSAILAAAFLGIPVEAVFGVYDVFDDLVDEVFDVGFGGFDYHGVSPF